MTRHWTILMSRLLWCEPFGRRCEGSSGHELATLKVRDRMLMGASSHPSCTLLLAREARCQQAVTYARVAGNISLTFVVTTFTLRCVVTTSCSRPLIAPSHADACSRSRPKESKIFRIWWSRFPPSAKGVLCGRSQDPGVIVRRLSCRGNRHRTNPCHAHPHDPCHVTQRSRASTPTAQVPRVKGKSR